MKCIPLPKMDYLNSGCTDLMRIMKLESSSNAKYIEVRRQETSHSVRSAFHCANSPKCILSSIFFCFRETLFGGLIGKESFNEIV